MIGDCVVRAMAIVLDKTWEEAYIELCIKGFILKDMPNANHVWGRYLSERGFKSYSIADTCPDCYTIRDFCLDNQNGIFVLATGSHVVAVIDGDYLDAWDSGSEVPITVWRRE